ncbi:TPA: hypothetical protein SHX92_005019 [Escherichia coli]|nr:hypothetical protein [Escherichia coli]
MQHNCLIMPDTPLPDPDVVRRFVLRTVVQWLCLLMIVTNGAIVIHTQRLKSDPGGNLLS